MRNIAGWIGGDKKRFSELIEIFLHGAKKTSQMAGWALSYCAEAHPELIVPHIKKLLKKTQDTKAHNSAKRHVIRVLQYINIPEKDAGFAAQVCFDFLADKNEEVAIRVFSMTVLFNLVKREPGLKNELKLLIEENINLEKAAFKSRGRKILTALEKMK
ncbi:MAG: hypothetical protein ACKVPJ_00185 [Chitinophagales bacterium]